MNRLFYFTCIFLILPFMVKGSTYKLLSPDKSIELEVSTAQKTYLTFSKYGKSILNQTPIGLIVNGKDVTSETKVIKERRKAINDIIEPIIRIKSQIIPEKYNELILDFKGGYSLALRAYNEGIAYRFITDSKDKIIVNNEKLSLNLPTSSLSFLMKENSFQSMSESPYINLPIAEQANGSLFSLPCLFKDPNGFFILLTESDVEDYPGMWIQKNEDKLCATFPQKVLKTQEEHCTSQQVVTERADYIASTKGKRTFPWRIFAIADKEKDLICNQMVYLLGKPAVKQDFSWIKPGIATLDWWGRRNIFNTEFKGGVNTATHKYFVDFNSKYGLKYFILDDGWSDACDLKKTNPELDLDALRLHAQAKGVGLVFWTHAFALKKDIPGYLDFMKSKGAVGIKVDFFSRDDQDAVNLFHEIAREALARQIVVDFHGICKPIGLNRTYPNVLTSEGLIEFEMNGVSDWDNPVHHTLLPFIRMVAGPMDYLPGTLNNAQRNEFHQAVNRPVGLGTRAHSMSLSVLFESPITMLPDSPADYLKEDECTSFLSKIPTVWDETRVIDAKIGEYVIIARRSGNDWFLAAITNWNSRELTVNLDFLGTGNYNLEVIKDGMNANTRAIDYKKENSTTTASSTLKMKLAQGGGWVGHFFK